MVTRFAAAGAVLLLAAATASRAAAPDAPRLDDEFDNPATLTDWQILKPFADHTQYLQLDLGKTRPGWLTVRPRPNNTWYMQGMGFMAYKTIEGDFMLETRVETHSAENPAEPPRSHYNSAGLIVRDPASTAARGNWVVVNVGRESPFTGTEIKTAVNSRSHLELQPGSHNGRLRLARIGNTIYGLKKLDGEDKWTLINSFERRDLPRQVQVGLMCNGWVTGQQNSDLVAQYDYVHFSVPTAVADLTADAKQ